MDSTPGTSENSVTPRGASSMMSTKAASQHSGAHQIAGILYDAPQEFGIERARVKLFQAFKWKPEHRVSRSLLCEYEDIPTWTLIGLDLASPGTFGVIPGYQPLDPVFQIYLRFPTQQVARLAHVRPGGQHIGLI